MKVILSACALFVSLSTAANCQAGLDYCAFNLMGKGNYHDEIYDALKNADWPIDPTKVNFDYYLYRCHDDGTISKTENCPWGCVDGGDNNDDSCE
ncbi:hypothetical protein BDV27DRAFT_162465 [Aspergillus caelatus]|uniref:Uncharacterized protein n=1 Tax=Aspergillus caelatus TaxID=61420 RepID=A0A5N6ZQZ8_9EURO|nr:uncharacterized protein BDV27DRAFT_162465 [Aspergillus caelatus]KAE8359633.1 hypothetical protein BDV27DRAFT_162465 [Aspergillus caelatus]